jgi:hypothetical protein
MLAPAVGAAWCGASGRPSLAPIAPATSRRITSVAPPAAKGDGDGEGARRLPCDLRPRGGDQAAAGEARHQ